MSLVPLHAAASRIALVSGLAIGAVLVVPVAVQMTKMNEIAENTLNISTDLVNTRKELEKKTQDRDHYYGLYKSTSLTLEQTRSELAQCKQDLKRMTDDYEVLSNKNDILLMTSISGVAVSVASVMLR